MIKVNFIPIKMRLPLKFGAETISSIQIAHVEFEAYGKIGIGETPLSVAWAWPANLSFAFREQMMHSFCSFLGENWEVCFTMVPQACRSNLEIMAVTLLIGMIWQKPLTVQKLLLKVRFGLTLGKMLIR